MVKKKKEYETQWNRSVKIPDYQEEKVKKLVELLGPSAYKSLSDFVVKAVDHEIRLASFRSGLSDNGKYQFDMMYEEKLRETYEHAYTFDSMIPGSPSFIRKQDSQKMIEDANKKLLKK